MGLMDLFRRQTPASELPKSKRAARQQAADHEATVQRLRQQARRRLLGAAVLVGVAIVAFPLVFETQPRPVPMDLPIVIPSKEGAAEAPVRVATTLPQAAQRQTQSDATPAPAAAREQMASMPASAPVAGGTGLTNAELAPTPTSPLPARAADVPVASVDAPTARYVVQVGAFADRTAAQAARRKLEARGLKTYTQVAKTKDGDRVRVRLGPFADRVEADKAAAKARSAGMAANVLSL